MTKTGEIIFFCGAFLSQILLLSWVYAGRVARDRRYVLEHFPPATHPKLYPQPLEYYQRKLRNFTRLNAALIAAGFVILVAILGALAGAWDGGFFDPSQDHRWSSVIVVPYYVLQVFAALYLDFSRKHGVAMLKSPPPRVRTTELRRRRISDFASPAALIVAVVANVAFIAFALYYRRFDFPWYTAAGNIAGVCFLLFVLALSLVYALHAPRADPYQRHEDGREKLRLVVQHSLAICLAAPVLITAVLVVKATGSPDFLGPSMTSLYCQGFALAMLWPQYRYRVEKIDFDVYRPDPAPPSVSVSSR